MPEERGPEAGAAVCADLDNVSSHRDSAGAGRKEIAEVKERKALPNEGEPFLLI